MQSIQEPKGMLYQTYVSFMMDQGASSAGKIILLEDSHAEAGLGQSSRSCNSANASAWCGEV